MTLLTAHFWYGVRALGGLNGAQLMLGVIATGGLVVVLDEEHMSWLLFQNTNDIYLSVVCGTVGTFTVEIKLTNSEVSSYKSTGKSYIDQLASSIRAKPEYFTPRKVANFRTKFNVTEALYEWRSS